MIIRKLTKAKMDALEEDLFNYNRLADMIKERRKLVGAFSDDSRLNRLVLHQIEIERLYLALTDEQRFIFDKRWILDEGKTWEEIAKLVGTTNKSMVNKREKLLEKYAKIRGEF